MQDTNKCQFLLDLDNNIPTIRIKGQIELQNVRELHCKLVQLIQQNTQIYIDLSQVNSIDLSFVQLLIAAAKYAKATNKLIYLYPPALSSSVSENITIARFPIKNDEWLGLPILKR